MWMGDRRILVRRSTEMNALERIHLSLAEEQPSESNRAYMRYMELLALHMDREFLHSPVSTDRSAARVSAFMEQVRTNLKEKWTIESMAAELGVSRTGLFRLFEKLYGSKPMRLLTEIRIAKAKMHLRGSDLTLDEIAEDIGYANAYCFSDAFLKAAGERPGRYRRRFRSNQGGHTASQIPLSLPYSLPSSAPCETRAKIMVQTKTG